RPVLIHGAILSNPPGGRRRQDADEYRHRDALTRACSRFYPHRFLCHIQEIPMPPLRSRTVTHGRNMAGARALLRATGVAREDLGKPIIAVANSFTEFVPGHVHLRQVGQVVATAVKAAGAVPREFNTIAVDDGIAMGHGGMLYSLPSRELIADSVEYM